MELEHTVVVLFTHILYIIVSFHHSGYDVADVVAVILMRKDFEVGAVFQDALLQFVVGDDGEFYFDAAVGVALLELLAAVQGFTLSVGPLLG